MSTHAIVGFVIAVVVIGGGIWYYATSDTPMPQGEQTALENGKTGNKGSGSLSSLFGMTGSYTCTISSGAPGGIARGTVYISDGNVRGDFVTVENNGQEIMVSMIQSGEYMYNWSSAASQGVKMKIDTGTSMSIGNAGEAQFDTSAAVDYSCEMSSVDANLFVPPSEVQFMDLSAAMQNMPASFPQGAPQMQ